MLELKELNLLEKILSLLLDNLELENQHYLIT